MFFARCRLYLLSMLTMSAPGISLAGPSAQVPVGARAVALGGAFSAVADHATAIFWNPAGLTQIDHQQFTGNYANLFDSGIKSNFLAVVVPLSRRHFVAADWYRLGFADTELDFRQDRFDLSYGVRLSPILALGITTKYLRQDIALDQLDLEQASGSGFGADLGTMLSIAPGLRLAVAAQDVFDTKIEVGDGGSTVLFPRNVRLAAAYTLRRWGTLAVDVDDRYHVGIEVWPIDQLTFRAGFQDDRSTGEDATYSAGLGFQLGPIRFDYAYVDHPALDSTNYFGLTLAFNFNPALIEIMSIEAVDIFASLYKSYGQAPIATATVNSLSDEPLAVTFRTEIPGLTQTHSESPVLLAPRRVTRIPLTVVLPEGVMSHQEDQYVQIKVQATYQSLRLVRTESGHARSVFYGPGSIAWVRGVGQAAAFITVDDPDVSQLAYEAIRMLPQDASTAFGCRNVAYAAAVFDALGVLGLQYIQDPDNPYGRMSQDESAIDTIRYPRETLRNRGGDCDDTTVLVAALLGSLGVSTMLVDSPGHLSLLLDTGLHESRRVALGLDESASLVRDRRVWVPLETTAIHEGFSRAWARGAEVCARQDENLRFVDVDSAWSMYPPAKSPLGMVELPSLDLQALQRRIEEDAESIGRWREANRQMPPRDTALAWRAANEFARVQLRAGRTSEARSTLEKILEDNPTSAAALNNIGVVHLSADEIEMALEALQRARGADPDDAGIWLNIAVAQFRQGNLAESKRATREGLRRCGGYAGARKLLTLPSAQAPTAGLISLDQAQALFLRDLEILTPEDLPRTLYWKD